MWRKEGKKERKVCKCHTFQLKWNHMDPILFNYYTYSLDTIEIHVKISIRPYPILDKC